MSVTLAKNAGFCFGVKRATDFVEQLVGECSHDTDIYTIGSLIHNRLYNEALAARGVRAIAVEEAEAAVTRAANAHRRCVFVIRTHGLPKEDEAVLRRLAEQNPEVRVEDLTCPFVKRIHKIAEEETSEETRFVLLGNPTHPEVLGIMSYAKGEKAALPTADDIGAYLEVRQNDQKSLILAAQTTQSLQEWKKTQKFHEKLYTKAKIFDTICSVTENRQTEAVALARDADRMIVVGGLDSSNTGKLYELCRAVCPDTVRIESASELSEEYKTDATKKVAITAGASTPSGIILEVY
ncbi:MAG: 4-hydroxy-3-methylbut-2-enyl diphosphate reductase, partial [Ruminococcaceae bacterium]|nr:4-hydroxy-3-methylbut-2-enyl diphosphate reductase [Oscillospiraceae bacterium]